MKNKSCILSVLGILLMAQSCEKEKKDFNYLYFPAGRSFLGLSEIRVTLNDAVFSPQFIADSCGGYWIAITPEELPETGTLTLEYIRKKEALRLFHEPSAKDWLSPSFYIDCNDEGLTERAMELSRNCSGNVDKAKAIQQFVIRHLALSVYKDSFLEKASSTYGLGFGTCINFSRLFVALCRAAGVPARTVWGVIYGYNNDNIYDYHHQWAEIQDEQGNWHPADFNYTKYFDLNDIRYLDLIYAAEENNIVQRPPSGTVETGTVEYFNGYPATLTGRLGFELVSDNRPDSMTVRYVYVF